MAAMPGNWISIPPINRGSDLSVLVTLADESGAAVVLDGRGLTVFDESPGLKGRVFAGIQDAEKGEILIRVEGTVPIASGRHYFRLQMNLPAGGEEVESVGFPPFLITVR
jgi:hypothetical protein